MAYYWLCSYELESGAIVNPGNWYRIIELTQGHGFGLLEEVYETVRLEKYSHMPSRKKSIFVFNNLDKAKEFHPNRPFDLIYDVSIIDKEKLLYTFDMSIVQTTGFSANGVAYPLSINELREQANRYWESSSVDTQHFPEVLTESKIKINTLIT